MKAEQTAGLPVLRIRIDRRAIARYGINAADVLDVVSTLGGREVGVVLEGQTAVPAAGPLLPGGARRTSSRSPASRCGHPGGQLIPLSQLADIVSEEGPAQISHEEGRRRITVELNVRGRDLAGFVADAQQAIERAERHPGRLLPDLGRPVREPAGGHAAAWRWSSPWPWHSSS